LHSVGSYKRDLNIFFRDKKERDRETELLKATVKDKRFSCHVRKERSPSVRGSQCRSGARAHSLLPKK